MRKDHLTSRISYVVLISIFLGFSFIQAQSKPIIRTYNTEDGLSSHNIIGVTQGNLGYLWIATDDGLNRYDGRNFKVYRNEPGDTTTISDSRVTVLFPATYHSEEVLWVGTRNGLNRLSLETGLCYNYFPRSDTSASSNATITALASDSDGYLWVGTADGLFTLGPGGQSIGLFNEIELGENGRPRPSSNNIRSIAMGPGYGSAKTIWVGTSNGLKHVQYQGKDSYIVEDYLFDPSSQASFRNDIRALFLHESSGLINLYIGTDGGELYRKDLLLADDPPRLIWRFENFIRDIEIDPLGRIWVATYGGGVVRLTEDEQGHMASQTFTGSPELRNSLSNSHTIDFCQDKGGVLWVGTDNGLNAFIQPVDGFKTMAHKTGDPHSLIGSGIRSILEDSQGGLWVGTVANGLTYISPDRTSYKHFVYDGGSERGLTSNSITSIVESHHGEMWFGTWDGGLLKLNADGETFTVYTHNPDDNNSPPNNIIQGILEDDFGMLWLNTSGGLSRFDPENKTFINYAHSSSNSNSISSGDLQSKAMYLDRQRNLWIGSYGGGLNRLDLNDPQNRDPRTAIFHHYRNSPDDINSLSNDMIISLSGTVDDENEVLWAGTFNGGLNRIDLTELYASGVISVQRFDETNGLCDNVVFGIETDYRNQLWLSTGAGLAHFDPATGQFASYFMEDGLPSNSFFWGASHRSPRGELFFGGTDGLVHFFPETIVSINKEAPRMSITMLSTVDGPITKRPQDFNGSNHVFTFDQGPFTIEWALLEFAKPGSNNYWYMIEEIHEGWISAGNSTAATFSNLGGGEYTFRVKGSNYNGVQAGNDAVMKFRVSPPFYQTLVFKVLIVVFIALLIYMVIAIRTQAIASANKQLKQINKELNVLVAEKEAAEKVIRSSLKEKEALLREIYHRTKNNMSVIISILDLQAAKSKSEEITSIFDDIKGRIFAMSLVHEQLMRAGDLSAINLNTYVRELMDNLFRSVQTHGSEISRNSGIEPIELSIDTAVPLGLVLNEIITNSLKYAFPDGRPGEIDIEGRLREGQLHIKVKDNGVGFDQDAVMKRSSSLGLGIIRAIIEDQLEGQVTINSDNGTTYEIVVGEIQIIRRV